MYVLSESDRSKIFEEPPFPQNNASNEAFFVVIVWIYLSNDSQTKHENGSVECPLNIKAKCSMYNTYYNFKLRIHPPYLFRIPAEKPY